MLFGCQPLDGVTHGGLSSWRQCQYTDHFSWKYRSAVFTTNILPSRPSDKNWVHQRKSDARVYKPRDPSNLDDI